MNTLSTHIACAYVFLALVATAAPRPVEWWRRAARLTGTSESTRRSEIRALRATPGIEAQLRAELSGPRKALALDTIVALGATSLVPDLLKESSSDRTGIVFLSLAALLTPDNAPAIASAAEKRLADRDPAPSAPVKLVLIDLLGRLQRPLKASHLERFLDDDSPEVRSAALAFARDRVLRTKEPAYFDVLARALRGSPYQLRVQAIEALRDCPEPLDTKAKALLATCRDDKHPAVRSRCLAAPEESE